MKLMMIITGVLLLSTLICGLWLRSVGSGPEPIDPSSIAFHMWIGSATVLSGLVTMVLVLRA